MKLQVGDTFDEFKVLSHIGSGAFAEVFLAHDTILKRKVVLKQLSPQLSQSDGEWAAFVHEARLTASFFHPGIITVHALRIDPNAGSVILVMEYMDGGTLRDMVAETGALDLDLIWSLTYQVGDALSYLHTRGILHRDIKPENILYSREAGWFKLTDFGLSYHPDHPEFEALNEGQPGTLIYMSPEQTLNRPPLTERSDLYAFGAVLYEALSGLYYLPIDVMGSEPNEVSYHIQNTPPAKLTLPNYDAGIVDNLEVVLGKALAKSPQRRHTTVRRFVRGFTRMIESLQMDYTSTPVGF